MWEIQKRFIALDSEQEIHKLPLSEETKKLIQMEEIEMVQLDDSNRDGFYQLVSDYLPDSDLEKVKKRAGEYPKAYPVLMCGGTVIGVAFGWPRNLDAAKEEGFTLDGIAVEEAYQREDMAPGSFLPLNGQLRNMGITTYLWALPEDTWKNFIWKTDTDPFALSPILMRESGWRKYLKTKRTMNSTSVPQRRDSW